MISPYFSGPQGQDFGVAGLGGLLAQRDENQRRNMDTIGQFGGALGAGVVGAVQGSQAPGVFGEGTTPTSGAVQGGMMNFANAWGGGGGGGGDMNGFARLTRGGGGGEAGGARGGGMNFKQFAAMGKAADGVREAMRTAAPHLDDEDPMVLGMTDEEWKHAGTEAKVTALKGWQQGETAKAAMQAYDQGQQTVLLTQQRIKEAAAQTGETAARQRLIEEQVIGARSAEAADTSFGQALQQAARGMNQDTVGTLNQGNGPVNVPGSWMNHFMSAVARNPDAANSKNMMPFYEALARGSLEKTAADKKTVSFTKSPTGMDIAYSPETGTFQYDPASKAGLEPGLTARAVPARDAFGNLTGEMQMQVEGPPEKVQKWVESQKGGKSSKDSIPKEHIDYLKAHPDSAASFDAKYGKGAAAKHLK